MNERTEFAEKCRSECAAVCSWCRDRVQGKWTPVIVGGAVRDLLRGDTPRDYDVFFLGASRQELSDVFGDVPAGDKPFKRHSQLIGEAYLGDKTLQLIASPGHSSLMEKLRESDWNVSAFGFDGEIKALARLSEITPGASLRLMKVSNPVNELHRGFVFAERFGMVFDYGDVVKLCSAVVRRHRQRAAMFSRQRGG